MNNTAEAQGSRRPRVYVVEQQPYDYNPAIAYGEIVFMDPRRFAPDAMGNQNKFNFAILQQIRRELAEYIPGHDYIAPTGAPVRMTAVGMVLVEKGPVHKMLGFDNRSQRYLQYTIDLRREAARESQ